jgi:MFS family permease
MTIFSFDLENEQTDSPGLGRLVFLSSLGTLFQWYDFYLYGLMAPVIAKHFFSNVGESTAFVFSLLILATAFAFRPIGALIFGYLGDRFGRKPCFAVTIILMTIATFMIGILPDYQTIGVAAPLLLILFRIIQGLALGGEYGASVIYVAEHASVQRRGLMTGWIQTTATLGLFLSLMVITSVRHFISEDDFNAWGWRIPFWTAMIMLLVAIVARRHLMESPAYEMYRKEKKLSASPIKDSFTNGANLKKILASLFGLTAGQAVIWYTSQLYVYYFMVRTLKMDVTTASLLLSAALLSATPFFVFFGSLSDRIGRKRIILTGCFLASVLYFLMFKSLTLAINPELVGAQMSAPVVVVAEKGTCSRQFNPTGVRKFRSSCDIAKSALTENGVNYKTAESNKRRTAYIQIGDDSVLSFEADQLNESDYKNKEAEFKKKLRTLLNQAGYPETSDPASINKTKVFILLFLLVFIVAMVYGPIAALLVDMFPVPIRYTSLSVPYHLGNGLFGGFSPAIIFTITTVTGDMYSGLWYPIGVAMMTLIIGLFTVEDKRAPEL